MSTTLSVLLLEDDPSSIRLFSRKVQTAPVEIVVKDVRNREGFLRELETPQFDCVVIDYTLPDINGLEALRLVKEMAPGTPTIIYTGSVGEEKAVECMKEGATEFLLKTNSIRLVPAILSVVSQRRDHEARLRAEEALRESEANYRSLFESARDIIFTLSLDGIITALNPVFELSTGWKCEEWIGKHISEILHPDDNVRASETLLRILNGGHSLYNEYRVRRKTGDYIINEIHVTLQILNGEKVGFLGIAWDVTIQKKMEQQFRQAQKMESIGTLAGGIAHDFNNIMGIVYAYLTMAEQHLNDASKIKQDIEMIHSASDRAAALVRQLLTFARKSSVIIELIDVHSLINELVPMLQATFPKTIEIVLNLEETIPPINADKNQLHQALLNIAVNARDAMPNGGTLRFKSDIISGEKLRIRIPDAPTGEYVHLSIIDNGCGMDEDTKSKAFDPFFTKKQSGKGTGLGLAVVYGIIGSHSGFAEIESEINKGTIVHVYLPASFTKALITQPASDIKDIQGGKETILIVEDESPLRFYLKLILTGKGYDVLEASNGAEGVKVFEENKNQIKLIISDFGMPKLDGLGLLREIIEMQPAIKIVMTSGFITPEQKAEILKAGAKDIILKPYKPNEILQRIREVLDSVV